MYVFQCALWSHFSHSSSLSLYLLDTEEYCIDETFAGSCEENEVIFMETAVYGRLQIGKCIEEDMGIFSPL